MHLVQGVPAKVARIRSSLGLSPGRRCPEIDNEVMGSNRIVLATADPIEENRRVANGDFQATFFEDLTTQGLVKGFAKLNPPAGETPRTETRRVPSPNQKNPVSVDDDRPNTDDYSVTHGFSQA